MPHKAMATGARPIDIMWFVSEGVSTTSPDGQARGVSGRQKNTPKITSGGLRLPTGRFL